jgi:hypothetical protein
LVGAVWVEMPRATEAWGLWPHTRQLLAEDEPGAEFVGGVDFEAVFAR